MSGEAYVTDGAALQVVPVSELDQLPSGWRPASREEVRSIRAREASTAVGQQAIAATEGVGAGLTLGISRLAQENLGSPESTARAEARREHNPNTAMAGEIAGAVLPALATGGQSLGAQALARTPAGILARGAARLGAGAESVLATRGAQGAARIGGLAVEGATEGAVGNLAMAATESSLGNEELTAEKLWSSLGAGALLGGGIGGALGVASRSSNLFSGRASNLLDGTGSKTLAVADDVKQAAPQSTLLPRKLDSALTKLQAGVSGGNQELLRKGGITQFSPDAKATRKAAISKKENTELYTRKATEALSRIQESDHIFRDVAAGQLKAANVTRTVKRGTETVESARAYAQAFRDEVYAKTAAIKDRGIVREMRTWGDALVESQEQLIKKAPADLEAQLFIGLDNTRRAVFDYSKAATNSVRASAKPQARLTNQAVSQAADDLGQRARLFLQDESVWGTAAKNQARRNAALTENLNYKGDFDDRFARRTKERESAANWQQKRFIVDPAKVKRGIQNYGKADADFDTQSTLEFLRTRRELIDAIIEGGEVAGKELEQLKSARAATLDAEDVFNDAKRDLGIAEALDDQLKAESSAGIGAVTGAFAGGMLGGPAGAIAGVAAGVLTQPGAMMRRLAVVESLAQRVGKTETKMHNSIRDFIGASQKRFSAKEPRKLRRRIPVAAAATAAFGRSTESRRTRYNRTERQIREIMSNPVLAAEHSQRTVVAGLADATPKVASALAQQHQRTVSFLNDKLPSPPPSKFMSLQPHLTAWQISDTDIERFAKYLTAATNPLSVIDELESGRVKSETIETLQAIYPQMFDELRERVMTQLSETRAKIAHADVIQLSILFDFVGHPTLEPGFMARQQQRMQEHALVQQEEQAVAAQHSAKLKLDIADQTRSRSENIANTL